MSSTDTFRSEASRTALLEQLTHLIDEMDAFTRHLGAIPKSVLEARPVASAPSFKEIYGLLALFDEQVYGPAVEAVAGGEHVELTIPEDENLLGGARLNDFAMEAVVERIKGSRKTLVDEMKRVSDWTAALSVGGRETDLFGLAYGIAQHDAALLSTAAHRLHESRLTSRQEDLPK